MVCWVVVVIDIWTGALSRLVVDRSGVVIWTGVVFLAGLGIVEHLAGVVFLASTWALCWPVIDSCAGVVIWLLIVAGIGVDSVVDSLGGRQGRVGMLLVSVDRCSGW